MVRKDLADKYKLDLTAVKTWADLEPLLKTIKENEPAITPFYMSNTNGNGLLENLDWDYLSDASRTWGHLQNSRRNNGAE
ncbi:hypothetical protein Q0F98_30500 [Paenibacillus amylolyticus]|nr:hypothetical protein Q0F98_30500 [Paenibacillus amylolyticus]